MKYEEEIYARDLHGALTQELVTLVPGTVVSIEGGGVHWNCDARQGERFCSVSCFNVQGKPEYLIRFDHDAQTQAWGRASQKTEAMSAMIRWLQGQELQLLYEQFEFIDRQKRALRAIEAQVIKCCPELTQSATSNLRDLSCDLYELWFHAKDRSCQISYYGKNYLPDFAFHWDESYLFQVQTGQVGQMALVIKRWLCNHIMPSDLEKEFPWIDTGQLAKYYEKGQGIEGEFILSWDSIERFYGKIVNASFGSEVLEMIAQMRKKGYDKTLRAGQSLYSFIVSRSRRHGLRTNQPRIVFDFHGNAMDVYIKIDEEEKLSFPKIEYTSQIDVLVKRLEAKGID